MGHFIRWIFLMLATQCAKGYPGFVNPQTWRPWHPKPYFPRQFGASFLPPLNQQVARPGPVFNPFSSAHRPPQFARPQFYPWQMPWVVPQNLHTQYGQSPNVPRVSPPQTVSWRPGQLPYYYSKLPQYYSNYGQTRPNSVFQHSNFQQSSFPFQGSFMSAAKPTVLPVRTVQANPAFLPKYQGVKGIVDYRPQSGQMLDLYNNYGEFQHPSQTVKGQQQLQEPLQFVGR